MFTIPFIGAATDAGIALDFQFSESDAMDANNVTGSSPKPLGIDLWSNSHAIDLSPIVRNCRCYACSKHHRAYLQHLLAAKEMLGWVLLQVHNHHVMDNFFSAIRSSLSRGSFETDCATFEKLYESELPAKTGQGPR
jgi:queuine tRNA-ribosyltransferase